MCIYRRPQCGTRTSTSPALQQHWRRPRHLLQAHQEVLLKSELAAPGSLQKQCLFSLQPAPPKSNKSLPLFFFLLPSSCPGAIKRPVYYETWPPCRRCYSLSQPQTLGTYRRTPGGWLQPLPARLPPQPRSREVKGPPRPHSEVGLELRAAPGLGRCRKSFGDPPESNPPPRPSPSQGGPLHCTKEKKNFFFFPQTKINKQKNTLGSRAPGPAGLGTVLHFASKPKL